MEIELRQVTVKDLVAGYRDDDEDGVVGYGGKLDIRPPFQREFVYGPAQREAVIDTINQGFPLNVMYWAERLDGTYEIIDGQQRTISIAQYVTNEFSIGNRSFHNLTPEERNHIEEYELTVYVCSGPEREKQKWFETINIAGVQLTKQELRNATYSGSWVTDAKRYFSKTRCVAYQIGRHYMDGKMVRQDYLQKVIQWASGGNIEEYMGRHQHDADAKALWNYFQEIVDWIERVFTTRRPAMKKVEWGPLFDAHKDDDIDPVALEEETKRLIADDDVQKQQGIYPYLLTRDERHLDIRAFPAGLKQRVYEKQNGNCAHCGESFDISEMEADHITPWAEGGKTVEENCQMLCKEHNRRKAAR